MSLDHDVTNSPAAFSKRRSKKKGKKKPEFIVPIESSEIIDAISGCKDCSRRMAALTILQDISFAFGRESTKYWPTSMELCHTIIRFENNSVRPFDREAIPSAMILVWKQWGAIEESNGRRCTWDINRVQEILSYVTLKPSETNAMKNDSNQNRQSDSHILLTDTFIRRIPMIVETVAFAGKDEGASTATLIQAAGPFGTPHPGPLLRAIKELKCNRNKNDYIRYFLSNEDGYNDPLLAGVMSQGGDGVEALKILQKMAILCHLDQWPSNIYTTIFALSFCDCSVWASSTYSELSQNKKVLECWFYLGVFTTTSRHSLPRCIKKEKFAECLQWNKDRIHSLLSNSMASHHLDEDDAIISVERNIPILDVSALGNLKTPEKDCSQNS